MRFFAIIMAAILSLSISADATSIASVVITPALVKFKMSQDQKLPDDAVITIQQETLQRLVDTEVDPKKKAAYAKALEGQPLNEFGQCLIYCCAEVSKDQHGKSAYRIDLQLTLTSGTHKQGFQINREVAPLSDKLELITLELKQLGGP